LAIGERLKSLRKGVGLTQMGFAKSFQVSNGAVAMWETNKREPDNETLSRLADFFGVSVDYLLGRENEKTPPVELTEGEKRLMDLIVQLTDAEAEELSNYVDYLISKRK
jgi:transcriptional regulator with XRE-family HTH domain